MLKQLKMAMFVKRGVAKHLAYNIFPFICMCEWTGWLVKIHCVWMCAAATTRKYVFNFNARVITKRRRQTEFYVHNALYDKGGAWKLYRRLVEYYILKRHGAFLYVIHAFILPSFCSEIYVKSIYAKLYIIIIYYY